MRRRLSSIALLLVLTAAESRAAQEPTSRGAEVIREMNLARQHPDLYATFLEARRGSFRGLIFQLPGGTLMRTREGSGALEEAIRFLHGTRPLASLNLSSGMSLAAADHVADQADGSYGHRGSDRSNPGERLNRHGTWRIRWGENISYGKTSARDVVIALIIDDGQRARKHRQNIFNPAFNFAGAAVGPHARYRTVCSIDFADAYLERDGSGLSNAFVTAHRSRRSR